MSTSSENVCEKHDLHWQYLKHFKGRLTSVIKAHMFCLHLWLHLSYLLRVGNVHIWNLKSATQIYGVCIEKCDGGAQSIKKTTSGWLNRRVFSDYLKEFSIILFLRSEDRDCKVLTVQRCYRSQRCLSGLWHGKFWAPPGTNCRNVEKVSSGLSKLKKKKSWTHKLHIACVAGSHSGDAISLLTESWTQLHFKLIYTVNLKLTDLKPLSPNPLSNMMNTFISSDVHILTTNSCEYIVFLHCSYSELAGQFPIDVLWSFAR